MWPTLKTLVLVVVLAGACVGSSAQDRSPGPFGDDRYADDPCGDPRLESSVWAGVKGKVIEVVDGDTIAMIHKGKRLRVQLLGIEAPVLNQKFGREAQQLLERLVQNIDVEVWVSTDWWSKRSMPEEILGVIYILERDMLQVNLELMRAGLVLYKSPPSYKMSGYSACHLAKAEEKAQAAKLGLWSASQ
jgi:endonuclease YncB( thermonuclease family)